MDIHVDEVYNVYTIRCQLLEKFLLKVVAFSTNINVMSGYTVTDVQAIAGEMPYVQVSKTVDGVDEHTIPFHVLIASDGVKSSVRSIIRQQQQEKEEERRGELGSKPNPNNSDISYDIQGGFAQTMEGVGELHVPPIMQPTILAHFAVDGKLPIHSQCSPTTLIFYL